MVLHYLAYRLRATLNRLEEHGRYIAPLQYHWKEADERMHRVVLYKSPAYFRRKRLAFVGFLSKKQASLPPMVSHDIVGADQALIDELTKNPWLLSYSSMELEDGNWCNLVVFYRSEAKTHIGNSTTHRHAAHQLAPQYYEWVRLHNGIMLGGLEQGRLIIQSTKYYTFQQEERPIMQERRYKQARSAIGVR
jgi:hypothetical protein